MPRLSAPVVDGAIAIAFVAALLVEAAVSTPVNPIVAVIMSLVIGASLTVRRRLPLLGYGVGSAALVVFTLLSEPSSIVPYANLLGLFSLGLYGSPRRALLGPVIMVPGVLTYFAATHEPLAIVVVSVLLVWLAGWAIGYQLARSREQATATREALRREAMADERVSIARELHDVVGHTVNLMLVQSGATRLVMDSDPAKAKELLSSLEDSARQALGELDQLLGLLRNDREAITQPGLAELPTLAERVREAGLDVTLEVDTAKLAPQLDVVVYRIVQEALTNALRHGSATRASVRVGGASTVTVDVDDNGRSGADYAPGRGLRGMAERAALFGGTVTHRRDDDGFHVHAELVAP